MLSGNEWVILIVLGGVLVIPVLVVLAIVGVASRRKGAGTRGTAAAAPQKPGAPPPGWFPDPTGRNEQRYWDGRTWTDAVVSNGQPDTDPI